ncbi:MAG: hypothetical protein RL660_2755 [Bacteroidota bacterium]|jgi:hypothetical protein
MAKRLVIYSAIITVRLQYVLHFVCDEVLQMPYVLTDKQSDVLQGDCVLNYSHTPIEHSLQIIPSNLLFESNVAPQTFEQKQDDALPKIFCNKSDIGFDVLAAIFYVLTRYEEYLPHKQDMYGRFAFEESLQHKLGVLDKAIVNRWAWHLYEQLIKVHPTLQQCKPQSSIKHTYDIDMAYANAARSQGAMWRGVIGSTIKLRFKEAIEKLQAYQGYAKDAFDCFDEILAAHQTNTAHFFWLVAEKNTSYDKNNLPTEPAMKELIERISKVQISGIHPSYEASRLPHLIEQEMNSLQNNTSQYIDTARFHYIRYLLPSSYEALVKYGIREDYSCGYGSTNGFRCGTAQPHYWFNLKTNETSTLRLQPFVWMDANCHYEHKYNFQQSLENYNMYAQEVEKYGGVFTPIWHNFLIGTRKDFANMRQVWQRVMLAKLTY